MHALWRRGGGVVQTKCDDHNVDTDVGMTFSPMQDKMLQK